SNKPVSSTLERTIIYSHFQENVVSEWAEYISPGVRFPCVFTLLALLIPNSTLAKPVCSTSPFPLCYIMTAHIVRRRFPHITTISRKVVIVIYTWVMQPELFHFPTFGDSLTFRWSNLTTG